MIVYPSNRAAVILLGKVGSGPGGVASSSLLSEEAPPRGSSSSACGAAETEGEDVAAEVVEVVESVVHSIRGAVADISS